MQFSDWPADFPPLALNAHSRWCENFSGFGEVSGHPPDRYHEGDGVRSPIREMGQSQRKQNKTIGLSCSTSSFNSLIYSHFSGPVVSPLMPLKTTARAGAPRTRAAAFRHSQRSK